MGGQPLRGLLGRGGGAWTAAALVFALVFTSGVGRSAVRFASGERASLYRWLDASMVAPDLSPIVVNNRADWLAFDPDAPDTSLRLAREQIAELVGEHPGVAGFLDTLALLHYRLGEFEPAIDAQRAALDLAESGFLAARLAQLEARHLSQSGVLRQGRGSQLEIAPRARDGALEIVAEGPALEPAIVHVLVRDGERPEALVELSLEAGRKDARAEVAFAPGLRLDVTLIDGRPHEKRPTARVWLLPELPPLPR